MQVLNDPAAMRVLLLTYSEKVLALEDRVSELKPKADALDRISTADGRMCITNAAKNLGLQRKSLIAFLSARRWIYRRAGGSSGWTAYQDKIQAGYLEHKVTAIQMPDGSDRLSEQVLVTPKGLAKLALIAGGVVKKAA
jgi:phage antirepressor YoqD-like protein